MSNKSKTYLYPLFHSQLELILFPNLENTYLYSPIGDYLFTLVYKFEEISYKRSILDAFMKLDRILANSTLLADIVESENKSKVAYTINVPPEILPTYILFKEGAYSKFPDRDKYTITRFNKKYYPEFPKEVQNIISILFNNPEYREELSKEFGYRIPEDIELSSKPNEEIEKFSLLKLNLETMTV